VPADDVRLPEALDEGECLRLLRTATVGRLGFTVRALPTIVPVAFTMVDEAVIIPAHRSSPMVTAARGAVVAFEVDSYDAATETGWSVTVVGPSRVLGHPDGDADWLGTSMPSRWTGPDRSYIWVQVGIVHGWRTCASPDD
jgi:nitroimidazol reductase NimA-like FMN-containing flavoprotein (pyridoxamine 5'-phosphate oxidase superfamily)